CTEIRYAKVLRGRLVQEQVTQRGHCLMGEPLQLFVRWLLVATEPLIELGECRRQIMQRQPGTVYRPANQFRLNGNGFGHDCQRVACNQLYLLILWPAIPAKRKKGIIASSRIADNAGRTSLPMRSVACVVTCCGQRDSGAAVTRIFNRYREAL